MMRDSNGVQSVLQQAGNMGRGGDDQMAHIGTGEIMIPPEVVDNYPQILPQVVKAFQNAGLDWRKYMAGGPNQQNPKTGAPEFKYGADTNEGGASGFGGDPNPGGEGGDPGGYNIGSGGFMVDETPNTISYSPDTGVTRSENGKDINVGGMPDMGSDPGFDPKEMLQTPGGPLGYGLKQAAKHMFSGPGYSPAGGMAATIGGRAANRDSGGGGIGMGKAGSGLEKNLFSAPSAPVEMPSYLEFAPGMTDLQKRAQIATYALNADDSRYGTQETQDYYKSLIQGMAYEDLLPIEQQYLTQVLGVSPGQSISAANQIAGDNPLISNLMNDLRFTPGV